MKKTTRKTKSSIKAPVVEEKKLKDPPVKRQAVFSLQLTRFELLHLRDLMGILLPPDGSQTLSQALASVEERSLIESMLWEKLSKLCSEADLPLDAAAPDYIIAPVSPPPLGDFQVNQDLSSNKSPAAGFVTNDDEETEEE
jgi:hypothetical protein